MIYTVTLNPTIDRTMRFPRIVVGALNRASSSRVDLSGKGVNVSVAMRQLGLETVTMGVAAGLYGQMLTDGLRACGHVCDFVEVAGETRSNVTAIDEATGVTTKLNEPGPTVTVADLDVLEGRLLARIQPGDWCVFSGSLPPGLPADTYARLVRSVQGKGAVAILDSSDEPLALGCRVGPDWVKPNAIEAASLADGSLDTEEGLASVLEVILALGPKRVLISLDERGAAYSDGTGSWLARPPRIDEVSAVGAGDAGLSAALWAWGQGYAAEEIVRWAVAGGTAAAMEDGSAMPTLAHVRQVYGAVMVTGLRRSGAA
ncbi:MAG: 1-phosphofructokinase family hexose kinase [Anaerolineae bacterium]